MTRIYGHTRVVRETGQRPLVMNFAVDAAAAEKETSIGAGSGEGRNGGQTNEPDRA